MKRPALSTSGTLTQGLALGNLVVAGTGNKQKKGRAKAPPLPIPEWVSKDWAPYVQGGRLWMLAETPSDAGAIKNYRLLDDSIHALPVLGFPMPRAQVLAVMGSTNVHDAVCLTKAYAIMNARRKADPTNKTTRRTALRVLKFAGVPVARARSDREEIITMTAKMRSAVTDEERKEMWAKLASGLALVFKVWRFRRRSGAMAGYIGKSAEILAGVLDLLDRGAKFRLSVEGVADDLEKIERMLDESGVPERLRVGTQATIISRINKSAPYWLAADKNGGLSVTSLTLRRDEGGDWTYVTAKRERVRMNQYLISGHRRITITPEAMLFMVKAASERLGVKMDCPSLMSLFSTVESLGRAGKAGGEYEAATQAVRNSMIWSIASSIAVMARESTVFHDAIADALSPDSPTTDF